ncbi:MAG: efflux RND transporter permease subunit [Candidatus Limnocylindrales bacterium]
MMRRIIATSLRFRYLVIACAVGLMVFGASQVPAMPVDVFPEFSPPKVEVQTIAIGLSASEVEGLVTVPVEQSLAGIEGLHIIRSKSVSQLSQIELIFTKGTDLLKSRQLVSERLAQITPSLPTWAAPPVMIQPLSATSRVMKIGMTSADVSLIDMSMISYWTIRPRLLNVPGIASVQIWGERLKMLQVQVIPEKLAANRVAMADVMDAVSEALDEGILRFNVGNFTGTGGFVETSNQRLVVRHIPPVIGPQDLAHVTVEGGDGREIPLTEVAELVEDHQAMIGNAVVNDGEGIMLIVEKFPWANTLDVTRGIDEALAELAPGLPGITVDATIFRPASFIDQALSNLSNALLLGSLLVFAVLVLFLFEWRTALISLVAIPLSLMAATMVLYAFNVTINTMILAGLVISVGVVVDDAIIDVENITRRLRQARLEGSTRSTASIVLDSSLEVRSAIVYATLIDVVAVAPVFFIEGLSGAFFQPLVIAYGLAVLASLAVALTVTPAMAYILLRKATIERQRSPITRRLQDAYTKLITRMLRTTRPAFLAVGLVSLAGIAIWPQLGQSLLPDFKERDFLMHWVTAPGTSLAEETRVSIAGCNELRTIPGVRNCGSHIGQAFQADEPYGVEFGENWISIDPAVDYEKTLAAIHEVVNGYPGIRRDVQTYLKERIREVLTGSSEAIVIRIYGDDLQTLRDLAKEVEGKLAAIPGIVDLDAEKQVNVAQIQVEVDLVAAEQLGVKPGDIRRTAAAYMAGEEVGDVFHGGKAYDVQVWSVPDSRASLTDVENLLMDTVSGGKVALKDVASVSIKPSPGHVKHEAMARRIDVDANVKGRDLGAVIKDVEAALASTTFPEGYHPEMLGEFQERQAAQDRLLLFAGAALIGVFLLLQAAFGSTRLAILSFLTLPSALVGGVLAAWLGTGIISLGALVGFFTVLGIAARNGIMMINHFQHLERYEGEEFGPALVIRGARERLAPILMTALATGLALVPLAIAGDLPGHEIEHPMAIVILGGLVTSTLLNLFVVPSLYLRFGKPSRRTGPDSGPAIAAA